MKTDSSGAGYALPFVSPDSFLSLTKVGTCANLD